MQRLVSLTLAASTLFLPALQAQFSELAVTDDGRLYFTTNLAATGNDRRSKVYQLTADGLSLYADGGEYSDTTAGPTASSPLVSGDGSISGYARYYPCTGSCMIFIPRTTFFLRGGGPEMITADNLQISRNGRFLLGTSFDAPTLRFALPFLLDRSSQLRRTFPDVAGFAAHRQAVANDGSGLFLSLGGSLAIAPLNAHLRNIPGTEAAVTGILSPDASRIAYTRKSGGAFELLLTDSQGSAHQVLASSPTQDSFQPSFANDGTLLYLDSSGQPVLLAPGGEPRALAPGIEAVRTAILSGNAQLAWLATTNGRLLRVRTADSAIDEIVPETPSVRPFSFFAYPGSVIRMNGSGLSAQTQFSIGGTQLPISELRGNDIAVQIPWEFPTPLATLPLTIQGPGSPFRQTADFATTTEPTITFETDVTTQAQQIAHQDFRGLVSAADPARTGETLHIFARNLGPVDLPVTTGQPSPSSPPARATTPLACYLLQLGDKDDVLRVEGIPVPFAGLSGGLIGVYQIDATIPAAWPAGRAVLQCRMPSGNNSFRGSAAQLSIAP